MRSLLALGLLVGTASAAHAGTYLGLGIGTGPGTTGDMAFDKDGRSGRLHLGVGFGRIAVEAMAGKFGVRTPDGYEYDDVSLGLAGKLNVPLADHFEVFGRLGYQHSFLNATSDPNRADFDGGGMFGGAGFEYKLSLAVTSMSLFIDYTVSRSALQSPMTYGDREFGYTTRLWTAGATVSL
jgi:hypothetical protein